MQLFYEIPPQVEFKSHFITAIKYVPDKEQANKYCVQLPEK